MVWSKAEAEADAKAKVQAKREAVFMMRVSRKRWEDWVEDESNGMKMSPEKEDKQR